jgi:hypothetical protein
MLTKAFQWVETRLEEGAWFRRGVAIAILVLTYRLTEWAARFAEAALAAKSDLMAVAATITAVAGVPLALLTLLLNKYTASRNDHQSVK